MKERSVCSLASVLLLVVVVVIPVWISGLTVVRPAAPTGVAHGDRGEQILDAYANLPLTFVENRGQTDARVRYYAQGSRYAFYITPEAIMLSFLKDGGPAAAANRGVRDIATVAAAAAERPAAQGAALALRFVGGNPQAVPEARERAAGEVNYLLGDNPARWQTRLPSYAQVVYREIWPGVDV